MALIQIDYRVGRNQLMAGGTYVAPAATWNYPEARVYRDHTPISNGPQDANIPVDVPKNSQVVITVSDSEGRADIRMAPVRFLAGRWNHSTITVGQMENAETKPIDEPQFDVNHSEYYSLSYEPGSPEWELDDNATFNQHMHGVMIGNDTKLKSNAAIGPYMTFRTQSLEGILWYGLEFSVVEGDVDSGYFWFDPYIRVV